MGLETDNANSKATTNIDNQTVVEVSASTNLRQNQNQNQNQITATITTATTTSTATAAAVAAEAVAVAAGAEAAAKEEASTTNTVPFVPIYIEENNVIEGAKQILCVIRPNWQLNNVEFKKFTDGITNKLIGCFYKPTTTTTAATATTTTSSNSNNITGNINNITGNSSNNNDNKIKLNNTTTSSSSSNCDLTNNLDSNNSSSSSNSSIKSNSDTDTESETISESNNSNSVVLVRVYGHKTDLLIDRKAETENFLLLHTYSLAPKLYATFKNGLAYEYLPGVTLNTESVLKPEIWQLVACRMAEMHRLVKKKFNNDSIIVGVGVGAGDMLSTTATATATTIPSSSASTSTGAGTTGASESGLSGGSANVPTPMLWRKTHSFLDLVPEKFSDAIKHNRLAKTFLPISRVRDEFNNLYKHLTALNSPVVFCHNDLLLGNVIHAKHTGTVHFIDYEYADYNFQAFDIGNHFAELCGVDQVDYELYPNRDFQLNWLRVYLKAYTTNNDVTDADVERLYVQVNQFALAAHIFWTVWSLIQAEHSKIDFDYVDYAYLRYNEYLRRKDEFLKLKIATD